MNILSMSPLTELMRCFRGRRRELTNSRTHIDEELCLDAYEQIGGEAIDRSRDIEASAHKSECYDLEAVKLIRVAALDGITNEDLPALTKAMRLIQKSAELDHDIGGKAKVDAI
jgi:hypothetical protein